MGEPGRMIPWVMTYLSSIGRCRSPDPATCPISCFVTSARPIPYQARSEGSRLGVRWLAEKANFRNHWTTRRRPIDMFETEEKPALIGLPDTPFVLCSGSTVVLNSHVTWRP